MEDISDKREAEAIAAEQELAQLTHRVSAMRSVLVRLLQDLVQADHALSNGQASQLLEANEQLVVTALAAQTEAETVTGALNDASRLAARDPLTGLPNRVLLRDRLMHAMAQAKRHGTRMALLFLDLNNFKRINDSFGHAIGDRALKVVARSLTSSVRETDTVSRHGGDEFLILLAEVVHASDASRVAEKIGAALKDPCRIDEHDLAVTASIGISLYPDDGEDADLLIDRADAAMYLAKKSELGGHVFHGQRPSSDDAMRPVTDDSHHQRLANYERAIADHERRHADLKEANEQLVLAALGAQQLQAAAETAQARQSAFLAAVAQELSDPHAPIRVATAMLGRAGGDEPLLPRAKAIIERQTARMSRMVNDLLAHERSGSERLPVTRQVVDLAAVIDEAIRRHEPEIRYQRQTLAVDVPQGPVEVLGDPVGLAQVLGNLLANASMYAQAGSEIGLAAKVDAGQLRLTVSDSGIGITPEGLPKIFDPFMQDAPVLELDGGGLGIGLTVVRKIVEAHGGTIAAFSAGKGLGSQFVIELPLMIVAGAVR